MPFRKIVIAATTDPSSDAIGGLHTLLQGGATAFRAAARGGAVVVRAPSTADAPWTPRRNQILHFVRADYSDTGAY